MVCNFLLTRIVGYESDGSPAIDWNVHSVAHRRIDQVELLRICLWIIISKPCSHYVKVITIDMDRMVPWRITWTVVL